MVRLQLREGGSPPHKLRYPQTIAQVGIQEFLPDWTLIKKLITAPWLQGVYAVL